MPRGKNYVNQNTGMKLQGKEQVKELCFYGNACTRKDCIYRHDRTTKVIVGNLPKSYTDPCMAYLAGHCAFNDTTCRKYHPTTDEEITALLEKYNRIPCKFTIHCKTKGCLYKHVDPNAVVPMNHNMMNMMMNFNIHPSGNIPPPPTTQYFPPLASSASSSNTTSHPNQSKINSNVLSDPNLFPPLSKSSPSTTTIKSSSPAPSDNRNIQHHTGTSPSSNDYYCVPVTNNDSSSIYPNSSSSHTNHNNNNHSITNSASGTFASTPTTTIMNSTSSSSILKPVIPIDYRIKHQNNTNNISYNTTTNHPNPNTTGSIMYNHGIPNQYPSNINNSQSNTSRSNNEMNVSTGPPSFNITAKEFIPGGTNRYSNHH